MRTEKTFKNNYEYYSEVFKMLNTKDFIRGKDMNTFIVLCLNAQENGNLKVSKTLRTEIENILSLTTQSLTNSIARLKECGLVDGERGIYILKPELLWGGDVESREEFFKVSSFEIVVSCKK